MDALAFRPREKLLVTGSDDRFVKLWRLEHWEENTKLTEVTEIDTIRDHSDYINSIVIRDNYLYSSSGDINVMIHEYPNPNSVLEAEFTPVKPQVEAVTPRTPPVIRTVREPTPPSQPAIQSPPSPSPPSQPPQVIVEEQIVAQEPDTYEENQEEEEVTTSSASTDTSNSNSSLRRRRRWLIDKDEVEIKEEIGRGRYGVVYKGVYKRKVVAVKVSNKISPEEYSSREEGIIKEVGSFCRCKHPSLVRYYGLVTNKPDLNFWLVTEFVTGHSLATLIHYPEVKSLYQIRRKERLQMSACLASAIDYMHNLGLVNGDLTALNIIVCKKGKTKEIKITDYGLLKYKEVVEDIHYTPECSLMRNINCFVPPEILVGHGQWSAASDVWCLGALLLEVTILILIIILIIITILIIMNILIIIMILIIIIMIIITLKPSINVKFQSSTWRITCGTTSV